MKAKGNVKNPLGQVSRSSSVQRPSGCYWSPWGDAPQDGTGEVLEEGNMNRARGKAGTSVLFCFSGLSQAEQKKKAFQASREA